MHAISRTLCIAIAAATINLMPALAQTPAPLRGLLMPFDISQNWPSSPACKETGWVMPPNVDAHVWHMETLGAGSHMGEDWNGKCGGNSDKGAPLFAIGNGVVTIAEEAGESTQKGSRIAIRHSIIYSPAASARLVFDSVFLHLNKIESWVKKGILITEGDQIGELGNTGTSADFAHLHWEIQRPNTPGLMLEANPYQKPLSIAHALNFIAPSMFVDDRTRVDRYTLTQNDWLVFRLDSDAPGSTAFVEYGSTRKSLAEAISSGWIAELYRWDAERQIWVLISEPDGLFFYADNYYAAFANIRTVSLRIPRPGNNYQADRARQDMLNAVRTDKRFVGVYTKAFTLFKSWTRHYDLYVMDLLLPGNRRTTIAQITARQRPLAFRFTILFDPTTESWTDWKYVDPNHLY